MIKVGRLARFARANAVGLLFLIVGNTAFAADPYVSAGFLKFPADAQIGAVSAVGVDARDRVFVLQRGEPPILVFDAAGKHLAGWGQGKFKQAHGLRVDPAGNVWTTDNSGHTLMKFSPTGELLATYGETGEAGNDDEHFRSPDDLVFTSKGEILVADAGNGRIMRLSGDGKFIEQFGKKGKGPGEFAAAHALAIDSQDRLYVADRGNKRVQVFDPAGKYLQSYEGFGNPFGLLVVGNELIVTEGDLHKVFHIDRQGKISAAWGTPETLQLPHFMAVDSKGTLYVAEVNGKRVQMFKRAK